MAAPVYSTNFFRAASATAGPTDVYTVPGGNVAVVKCITIVYGDIIASGLDAWVQTEDYCKLARYTWAYTISTPFNYGGTALFYGTWVVLEGETLAVQTGAGTCDIQASGYLLTLP
jgi:hypothetical protein